MSTQRPLASLRIGIVGAGPAGLTAAEELRQKGYRNITVLESKKRAGGKAMSIPFHDKDGNQLGIYEGGSVFVLPSKIYLDYARRLGLTVTYDVFPSARCLDLPTGTVCHPFLVPSALPLSKRLSQILRFMNLLKQFEKQDTPGFDGPMYQALTDPCSQWFLREGLGFAREAVVPLVSAMQFPTTDGQIPTAYFIKTAILISRMSLYRQLTMRFPKFQEGNQVLWQRLAGEHTVLFRSTVRRVVRGSTVRVETLDQALEFDRLIWAAPTEDFLAVADVTPEERDVLSRVRIIKRAVITCRIDGLPQNVCYFLRNTVDHGVPMSYPYALIEVTPGTNVYNLYPYLAEDTSIDALVRNVYDLARRLGGKRAKLLSHPLLWKWFPYYSSEDFRGGVYDRFARVQGQNRTFFVGEILAGVSIPRAMEFSAELVARHFPRPRPVEGPEASVPVLVPRSMPASLLTTMPPPPVVAVESHSSSSLAPISPGAAPPPGLGAADLSYPRMSLRGVIGSRDKDPSGITRSAAPTAAVPSQPTLGPPSGPSPSQPEKTEVERESE
ncbi:MAG: FAD-dependent oxidoreductase [Polyangia bacterium]